MYHYLLILVLLIGTTFSYIPAQAAPLGLITTSNTLAPACKQMMVDQQYIYSQGKDVDVLLDPSFHYGRHYDLQKIVGDYQASLESFAQGLWVTSPLSKTAHFVRSCLDRPEACQGYFIKEKQTYEPIYCQAEIIDFAFRDVQNTLWNQQYKCQINPDAYFEQPLTANANYKDTCLTTDKQGLVAFKTFDQEEAYLAGHAHKMQNALEQVASNSANEELFYYAYAHLLQDFSNNVQTKQAVAAMNAIGFSQEIKQCDLQGNVFSQQARSVASQVSQQSYLLPAQVQDQTYITALNDAYLRETSPKIQEANHGFSYLDQADPTQWVMPPSTVVVANPQTLAHQHTIFAQTLPSANKPSAPGDGFKKENRYEFFKAEMIKGLDPYILSHLVMQKLLHHSYAMASQGRHYNIVSAQKFAQVFRSYVCAMDENYCSQQKFSLLTSHVDTHYQEYQKHSFDAHALIQDLDLLSQDMSQVNAYCLANSVSQNQYAQWDQDRLSLAYQGFRQRTQALTQHPLFEVLMGSPSMRKTFDVYESTPFERCMTQGTAFGKIDYNKEFLTFIEPLLIERQTSQPSFTEHTYFKDKNPREIFAPVEVSILVSDVQEFFADSLTQVEDLAGDWQEAKLKINQTAIPERDAYLRFVIEHFSVPLSAYSIHKASREYGYYLCLTIQDYDMFTIDKEQSRQVRANGVMVASVLLIPFTMGKSLLIPVLLGSSIYSINTAIDLFYLYQHKQVINTNVATNQMDWQDATIEMQRTLSSIRHEWTYFAISSVIGGAFSAGPIFKEAKLLLARTSRVYRQSFDQTVLRLEELYKVADPLERVHNLRRTTAGKILVPNQQAVHFLGDPSLRTAMADQLIRSTRLSSSVDDWLKQFEKHLLNQKADRAISMIVSDLPGVAKQFSLSAFKNTMALEQMATRHAHLSPAPTFVKGKFLQDPLFRHALGKKLSQADQLGMSAEQWLVNFEKHIAAGQTNAAVAMVQRDFGKLAQAYRLSSFSKIKPKSPVSNTPANVHVAGLKIKVPRRIKPSWQGFINVLEKNPQFAKARWQHLVHKLEAKGKSAQQIYQTERKLVVLMEHLELYAKKKPGALSWFTPAQVQSVSGRLAYHRNIAGEWVEGTVKQGQWISFSSVRAQILKTIGKKGQLAQLPKDLLEKLIHPLVRSRLLDDLDWTRLITTIEKLRIQTQVDVRSFQEAIAMINRHNKSISTYIRPGHTQASTSGIGGWLRGNRKLNPNYYQHRKNYLIDHFEDVYLMQRYSRYRLLETKYEAAHRLTQALPGTSNQLDDVYRVIDQANPFASPLGAMERNQVKKALHEMEQTDVVASLLGKGGRRQDSYLQYEWKSYQKAIDSLNKNVDDLIKQGKTSVAQWSKPFRTYDFHRRIRGECVTPTSSLTTVANAGLAKIMIWMSALIELGTYGYIHRNDELDYESTTRGLHEVAMQGVFAPVLRYLAFTNVSPIALFKMASEAVFFSFVGAPVESLEFHAGEELIWGHDGKWIQNDNTRKQLEHALQSNPELVATDDNPWLDWSAPELQPVQKTIQDVLAQAKVMGDDATEDQWFDWFLQKELTAQMQSNEELEDYVVDQFSTFLWEQEQAEKEAFKAQGNEDILTFLTLGDEAYHATVEAGVENTGMQYYMFNRGWMVAPSLGISYLTSQGVVSLLCRQRLSHLWNVKAATSFYVGSYTGFGLWYLHARNQTMGK